MESKYRITKNVVSKMRFHVVFCPKYKRKIFNVPGVRERFVALICAECKKLEIDVLELECGPDYVHMKIDISPSLSANNAIYAIKKSTGKTLRSEFEVFAAMTALWTKSYFITTDDELDDDMVLEYVESQANGPIDARKKKSKTCVEVEAEINEPK